MLTQDNNLCFPYILVVLLGLAADGGRGEIKGCFHPDNVGFPEPLKARTQCSLSTLLMCTLEETPIAFLTSLEVELRSGNYTWHGPRLCHKPDYTLNMCDGGENEMEF